MILKSKSMKKIFYASCFLTMSVLLLTSCGDENNPAPRGPNVVLVTDGYLCTIGPSSLPGLDTLYYAFSSGGREVTGYRPEWADNEQQIRLTVASDHTMRVEMKTPYTTSGQSYKYLGVRKAGNPSITSFPNHEYQFQLYKDPVPETEFVIARDPDDIHKFTIESNLYKGQYLTTGKWKGHLGVDHPNLVFETGKKYWFFK
jgi:hypothetical protein